MLKKDFSIKEFKFIIALLLIKELVRVMKKYSYRRRTVQMVLTITIVFNLLPCFVMRNFLSTWDIFFLRKKFSFSVRLFFCYEKFSFSIRLFLSLWDFFFPRENFSTQSEKFWSTIQEGFGRLRSLCLVMWARFFYSLEKEEVRSGKVLISCVGCN